VQVNTHVKRDSQFCIGVKLKAFSIYSADNKYNMTKDTIDVTKIKIKYDKLEGE
jgi:hypothetical protein